MDNSHLNIRGTPKQDLTAARAELKQFRHDVAVLKRKGILTKSKYDARSVLPTKYLKSVIKEFADVLKGTATTVKVPKGKKDFYKQHDYKIRNNRVVVPVRPGEKVRATSKGITHTVKGKGGSITTLSKHYDKSDLNLWKDQIRRDFADLKKGESLAFQYFGNNSYGTYSTADQMIDILENHYTSFQRAESDGEDDYAPEDQVINNISVFIIRRDKDGKKIMPEPTAHAKEITEDAKRRRQERERIRYVMKLNSLTETQENEYHAERAKAERERRKKMRETSGDKTQAYRDAAKIRAQQSRDRRKNEKG